MTEARPRPWAGALLGLLLGALVTAILWLTGVVPPDRLPLFGILAVSMAGAMALTTQRLSAARGSTITVIVISSLLGGVALTGIPEVVSGGSLSNACTFEATSSQESDPVGPADTSALAPFDVTTTDTVQWSGTVPETATTADVDVALMVGGFAIPLYSTVFSDETGQGQWGGSVDVASALAQFKDEYAFDLTGTYHFSAQIAGEGEGCMGAGYARVLAPSAFDGVMLAVLWALLATVLVAIIVIAVVVRRSFSHADALARTTSRDLPYEESIGTGGPVEAPPARDGARTAGTGAAAAGAGAGATAPGEAARRDAPAGSSSAREGADAPAGRAPAPGPSEPAPAPAAPPAEPEPAPEPEAEPEPEPEPQAPHAGDPALDATDTHGEEPPQETTASAGQDADASHAAADEEGRAADGPSTTPEEPRDRDV